MINQTTPLSDRSALKLPFYPALDGLRAFAVLQVIAYHCRVKPFSGGFLGVDLFFAISGFLITLMLLLEWQASGTVSLKKFYMRRVRRLFPALVFFLLVFLLTCYLQGRRMERPLIDAAVSLLNIANWTRAFGYGVPRTLGHLWSLSLEVQFYILWAPLCFWILRRWQTVRAISIFCVVIALTAYLFRFAVLEFRLGGGLIYNGLFSRLDAFAIGGLLSTFMIRETGVVRNISLKFALPLTVCAGIALFAQLHLATNLHLSQWTRVPWMPFVASLPSFFLVLGATGAVGRVFPWPFAFSPVQYLGQISYGLYLWHYPIIHLFRFRGVTIEQRFFICVALTILCASVSYFLVERPFLRKRHSVAKAGIPATQVEAAKAPLATENIRVAVANER